MDEVWKPVAGQFSDYTGLYEVSSRGRVRSLDRWVNTCGGGVRLHRGRILKPGTDGNGRLFVNLARDKKNKIARVHRLVAEAFIPNPENLPLVRHWNDVNTDNRVENLLWGTDHDNKLDSVRNGTHPETRKTHCKYGHPYSDDNLRVEGRRRICRVCAAERARSQKEKFAGKEPPKHGTGQAYNTYKCRCEECRAFWSKKNRDSKNRRKERRRNGSSQ